MPSKHPADRRDHQPEPDISGDHHSICLVCGDQVVRVYDRRQPVSKRIHYRHAKKRRG